MMTVVEQLEDNATALKTDIADQGTNEAFIETGIIIIDDDDDPASQRNSCQ
jgi:hypothetical protein